MAICFVYNINDYYSSNWCDCYLRKEPFKQILTIDGTNIEYESIESAIKQSDTVKQIIATEVDKAITATCIKDNDPIYIINNNRANSWLNATSKGDTSTGVGNKGWAYWSVHKDGDRNLSIQKR